MTAKGIDFSLRRENLSKLLLDDSVILLASSSIKSRNSDSDFPFRQDSNFYYLSGFNEPESLLVIRPSAKKRKYVIFCRDRDPLREQWDGFRSGQGGAKEVHGADEAYSISLVDEVMPSLLEGARNIYYSMSSPNGINIGLNKWLDQIRANTRQGSEVPENLLSLDSLLDELRLLKDEEELLLMRKAGEITCEAHIRAMTNVTPGMYEYQLEAEYLHTFIKGGARFPAYNSIVGGGNNSCILHYNENNSELADGDLVLVDAGCEYEHYASDVTRTFPVGKKFTVEQKKIYEIVLEAHKQASAEIKPGNPWIRAQDTSVKVITEGLIDLGLLKGKANEIIKKGEYSKFYMHRIGHWLGMDVHDVGNYKKNGQWRDLEPGMVLTIEPGIYILDSLEDVEEKWLGIGIRIEDDLLVTENGNEVLSANAPRDIQDIESLRS
jgi:Xaa-Pro aminopeptidase